MWQLSKEIWALSQEQLGVHHHLSSIVYHGGAVWIRALQLNHKTVANSLGFCKIRVTAANRAAMRNSDFQKDIANYCDVALSLSLSLSAGT